MAVGALQGGAVRGEDASSPARLRSRHRRLDRRRVAGSRVLGSLALSGDLVVGGGLWLLLGRWPVAVAWVLFAVGSALWAAWEYHRQRGETARAGDSFFDRGQPSVSEVVAVISVAAVFGVTLRFGVQWARDEAVLLPLVACLSALVLSWWRGRGRGRRASD